MERSDFLVCLSEGPTVNFGWKGYGMLWKIIKAKEVKRGQTVKNYGLVYHTRYSHGKYVVYSLGRKPSYYNTEDTVEVSE